MRLNPQVALDVVIFVLVVLGLIAMAALIVLGVIAVVCPQ